jgi:hypothetical protein
MLRRFSFYKMTFLLIGFIVCFSVSLLLSVVLVYRDVNPRKPRGTHQGVGRLGPKERALSALFGVFQAGLSIAGIIAIALALLSKGEMYWVDMAVRCNLHLLTGTNVRKLKPTLRAR